MTRIKRHPVLFIIAVVLLLFAALVVAGAEPSERGTIAAGMVMIYGVIVAVILGIVWLWRALFGRRRIRPADPPPAPIPPVPSPPMPAAPVPLRTESTFASPQDVRYAPPAWPVQESTVWVAAPAAKEAPPRSRSAPSPFDPLRPFDLTITPLVASGLLISAVVVATLTWALYTSTGWEESSGTESFWVLALVAPLLAPALAGLLLRSWWWVPASAVAFAAGGILGLWANGDWTMTNRNEYSLVYPTIFFFPGVPACAAAAGSAARLIRSRRTATVGLIILGTAATWTCTGLCYGLALVM